MLIRRDRSELGRHRPPRTSFFLGRCQSGRVPFVARVRRAKCPTMRRITMTQYLLSAHSVEGESRAPMTDEEIQQSYKEVRALEEEMKSAGAWLFGGRLHEPGTATVVRISGGEVLTTDGPFAESREHLGGFYIVAAEDLDAALVWASKTSAIIGAPIEIRPFQDEPGA